MRTLTKSDLQNIDQSILSEIRGKRSRYWEAGSWRFYRALKRADDGRFYAWIVDGHGQVIKLKGFKRRKNAQAWRDEMCRRRQNALRHVQAAGENRRKPEPTPLEMMKVKVERLKARIRNLDVKIKRLQTYRKKATRSLKYYQRKRDERIMFT